MKKLSVLVLAVFLALAVPAASMAADYGDHGEPSAGAIVFDIVLVRPLGVAATALGTAFFIAGLPFTLPTASVGTAGRKLVVDPLAFTFKRPIGEVREDIVTR